MTRKISCAAVVAGVAVGAVGVAAAPAYAADTLYFVNAPVVTGTNSVTPESATITGAVDTGGTPGTTFSIAAGATLSWVGDVSIINSATEAETFSTDGLPVAKSDQNVAVVGGTPTVVSNNGSDDYSDVQFEYDPLKDYESSGDAAGPETELASELKVETQAGLSSVSVKIGAFGLNAQKSTDRTPLVPDTKYVYWILDQAGATDDAEAINTFNPASPTASKSVNPNYVCYPDAYIQANTYLSTLTSTGTVSGGVSSTGGPAQTTVQPEIQGACTYFFGNVSGLDYYTSPAGEFTTPAIGKLALAKRAVVKGSTAAVTIDDKSAYKASGTIKLTTASGKTLASGKFALAAEASGKTSLKLTAAGVKAAASHASSQIVLTSNWDQPATTKSVKL